MLHCDYEPGIFNPKHSAYIPPSFVIDSNTTTVWDGDTTSDDTVRFILEGNHLINKIRWNIDSSDWSNWEIQTNGFWTINLTDCSGGSHRLFLEVCYSPDSDISDSSVTFFLAIPPKIISQVSASINVRQGDYCVLWVTADGAPRLHYQWYRDEILFDTINNDSIVFTSITEGDTGTYFCRVANDWGEVVSGSITVRFTNRPDTIDTIGGKEERLPPDEYEKNIYQETDRCLKIVLYGNGTTSGDTVTTLSSRKGVPFTLPGQGNRKKIGYEFIGWDTQEGGDGIHYDTLASLIDTSSDTLRFYAVWQVHRYPVIYHCNDCDGGIVRSIKEYCFGDTVMVSHAVDNMTKTGFSLSSWNSDTGDTGISYKPGERFLMETSYVTLYAQWNPMGMVRIPAAGQSVLLGEGTTDTLRVTFAHDFWIDATEVTQASYRTIMKEVSPGYEKSLSSTWTNEGGVCDDCPAYALTWYDAAFYCNVRSKTVHMDTVYRDVSGTLNVNCSISTGCHPDSFEGYAVNHSACGFRLPTEAEWLFAFRAGMSNNRQLGIHIIDTYAWHADNSNGMTHPVAFKDKNLFAVYDMLGNVWEWCNERWCERYTDRSITDWIGVSDQFVSNDMIVCGGAFNTPLSVFSKGRIFHGKSIAENPRADIGFRCVLPDYE